MSTPLETTLKLLEKKKDLEETLQDLINKSECPCGYSLIGLLHMETCTESTGKVTLEETDYVKTIHALMSLRKVEKELAMVLSYL